MTTKELGVRKLQPLSITVNEMEETITIVMPLCGFDTQSESGKMDVLCTTNGWVKTNHICPRTTEQIQANIFIGTRARR